MKKQLNVDRIQSELRGESAFFPGYKGRGSYDRSGGDSEREPALQPDTQTNRRSAAQDGVPPLAADPNTTRELEKEGVPPSVPRTAPRTDHRPDHLVPKV